MSASSKFSLAAPMLILIAALNQLPATWGRWGALGLTGVWPHPNPTITDLAGRGALDILIGVALETISPELRKVAKVGSIAVLGAKIGAWARIAAEWDILPARNVAQVKSSSVGAALKSAPRLVSAW